MKKKKLEKYNLLFFLYAIFFCIQGVNLKRNASARTATILQEFARTREIPAPNHPTFIELLTHHISILHHQPTWQQDANNYSKIYLGNTEHFKNNNPSFDPIFFTSLNCALEYLSQHNADEFSKNSDQENIFKGVFDYLKKELGKQEYKEFVAPHSCTD